MAKTHTLRIGIGTPEAPFVSSWRIWTQKSETYLACRQMAGVQKVSLHSSGIWTAAFTTQSGVEIPKVGNRRSHRWERPAEFASGWVQGPVIDVSRVDTRHDLPGPPHSDGKPITWLPAPQIRHKLQIAVLFSTEPGAKPDPKWYAATIGSLPLSNGETVWVMASELPMNQNDRRQSFRVRDVEVGPGKVRVGARIEPGKVSASVTWITTSPDGPPMLVQVPLGSHNFRRVEMIDRDWGK